MITTILKQHDVAVLTSSVLCSGWLKKCLKITAAFLREMNGFLPNHGFHINLFGNPRQGLLLPQWPYPSQPNRPYPSQPNGAYPTQPNVPNFPPQPNAPNFAQYQLQTGLALASLPPQQQLQLRAQLQVIGRTLMQQQIAQNFSFTNSDAYHRLPHTQESDGDVNKGDPVYQTICANIKDEILKQLHGHTEQVENPRSTREKSDEVESVLSVEDEVFDSHLNISETSPGALESTMESRGKKYVLFILFIDS